MSFLQIHPAVVIEVYRTEIGLKNGIFSVFLTFKNVFQNCEKYIKKNGIYKYKSNLLHKKITGIKKMLGNKL